jgi:hypothetical protein
LVELPDLPELEGRLFGRDRQSHVRFWRLLRRIARIELFLHARLPALMDQLITFS